MSLSSEPSFSILKDRFICGYHNIANDCYAGASGRHQPDANAVDTTNGAGPHNIQMFVLSSDGIVLTCLPGFWHSQDLASELQLAQDLNNVWNDSSLTREQKDQMFREMQLNHLAQHSPAERRRSKMQGFDVQYEVAHRLASSDVFFDRRLVDPSSKKQPPAAVKSTDVIMHERMAQRPFERYEKFDVAQFSDYGKPFYDKHEEFRMANGQIAPNANLKSEPIIGNDPRAHPIERQVKRQGTRALRQGLTTFLRYGLR